MKSITKIKFTDDSYILVKKHYTVIEQALIDGKIFIAPIDRLNYNYKLYTNNIDEPINPAYYTNQEDITINPSVVQSISPVEEIEGEAIDVDPTKYTPTESFEDISNLIQQAIESGEPLNIGLTEDISADRIEFSNENLTEIKFNGYNNTITNSQAKARTFLIEETSNERDITIKNIDVHVDSTTTSASADLRGISVWGVENLNLTIENATIKIDKDYYSWAFNTAGTPFGNCTFIFKNCNFESAIAINHHCDNCTIIIEDCILTSNYVWNDPNYIGSCIRIEGTNNKIIVKNTVFNGPNCRPITTIAGVTNEYEISDDCVDNTTIYDPS